MGYKRAMTHGSSSTSPDAPDRDTIRLRSRVLPSLCRWGAMAGASLRECATANLDHRWKRAGLLLMLLPLSLAKWMVDWVCLGLDELLFPGARVTPLGRPLMVLGPPRSGTTRLHRVLAREKGVRTSSTWEVFLAPSILQKRFFRGLKTLDSKVGRPLARMTRWIERRALKGFDHTHPSSLLAPEEDYFYLSTLFACTGWLLVFPADRGLRRWLPGAEEDDPEARRESLRFLRLCLRKQMYGAQPGTRLLCKNASFASWLDVLPEVFPEAGFVVCARAPEEAVPSMLSLAESALSDFGLAGVETHWRDMWIASMRAQYHAAAEAARSLPPDRLMVVSMDALRSRLEETVREVAARFEWARSDAFDAVLRDEARASKTHASRHRYRLQDFGLSKERIREEFPVIESANESLTPDPKTEKIHP